MAVGECRTREDLVIEVVFLAGALRALDERIAARTGVDGAGAVQQLAVVVALEFGPQFVGATEQRDVGRVFVVGETEDTSDTV